MGNEVSTVGGAVATAATSVAAGVTLGQVDALNDAVVECAKFTGNAASKTVVRHAGETLGSAVATGATAVAAGVTFGQVDAINLAVVDCAEHTVGSAVEYGKVVLNTASDVADGIPGVGHMKGGIHYLAGDIEGGDAAMKAASRAVGVLAGGVAGGVVGGPVGAVAGGIAGGAAVDGITTGVESAIKGKYVPSGQIKAWTDVVEGKDAQTVIGGVVGGVVAPVLEGVGGYLKGRGKMKARAAALEQDLAVPRNANPALNEFMAKQRGNAGRGAAAGRAVAAAGEGDAASFHTAKSKTYWHSARSNASSGSAGRGAAARRAVEAAGEGDAASFHTAKSKTSWHSARSNASSGSAGRGAAAGRAVAAAGEGDAASFHTAKSKTSWHSARSNASSVSVASNDAWKKILEKAEKLLDLPELDDVELYRGVNKGLNPYRADGHDKELGDGIYLIDSLKMAAQYATSQKPGNKRVPGEVYKYQYRADDSKNYMKNWKEAHGEKFDMDDFKIIKTERGDHYEYRFSPNLAQVLEEKKALKLCLKLE